MSKLAKLSFTLAATVLMVTLFQNCAGGFQTQALFSVENSLCEASECQASSGNTGGVTTVPGTTTPDTTVPGGSTQTPISETLYNFVAGTKQACEATIIGTFNKQAECTVGGGCGFSCGRPGANCASANPGHYGACLSADDSRLSEVPPEQPAPVIESLYNFVAGSKQTCENSILSRLGKQGVCTIGGGCGLSCGRPGANCPSANPSHYGACVSENDPTLREPTPTQTQQPTTKTYNFVAGDKATCESSVVNRLGIQVMCQVGGGCGLSCGVPSSTCVSANPGHYGACVVVNE